MVYQILYTVFQILLIIFLINLIIIGTFLLLRAYQNRMRNIVFFGVGFYFVVIGFLGNFFLGLGATFEEIFVSTGFILATFYTNQTFYKRLKLKGRIITLIVILLGVINVFIRWYYYNIEQNIFTFYLKQTIDIFFTFTVFGWMGFASYKAYQKIKDSNIQPWIIYRYKLLTFASFLLSFQAVPEICGPYGLKYGDPSFIAVFVFGITAILTVVFSICYAIAWFMPKRLKNYLNRDYEIIKEKELSEEDLVRLIKKELSNNNNFNKI
ncbi:MAG: hypothetical protein EU532_01490 [Promethearchaeota archaeon]|nr:MAG: hypothetical protein EU532_01490 [Candidatus Lokiarchaeota archaeon]